MNLKVVFAILASQYVIGDGVRRKHSSGFGINDSYTEALSGRVGVFFVVLLRDVNHDAADERRKPGSSSDESRRERALAQSKRGRDGDDKFLVGRFS